MRMHASIDIFVLAATCIATGSMDPSIKVLRTNQVAARSDVQFVDKFISCRYLRHCCRSAGVRRRQRQRFLPRYTTSQVEKDGRRAEFGESGEGRGERGGSARSAERRAPRGGGTSLGARGGRATVSHGRQDRGQHVLHDLLHKLVLTLGSPSPARPKYSFR